jgi:hypothetical protein
VLDAVSQLDVGDLPWARLFLHLRAIPARIAAAVGSLSARRVDAFVAEADGSGTLLTTRTCVHCPDRTSRRRFTPYWVLIRIPSGLIRRMLPRRIKLIAEARDVPPTRPE